MKEITDLDLKAVFRLVDVDKSGSISRTVGRIPQSQFYSLSLLQEAKMATKLLMKRFGIKDVNNQ